VDLEIPRDFFQAEGFTFVLAPILVDITGRVVLNVAGQDQPVPGARAFAVREMDEEILGAADETGLLELTGIPLEVLGSADLARVRVELPDALTLGGRFAPDAQLTVEIDLTAGAVDIGTRRFRRLTNPEPTVRLGGSLSVRDGLSPNLFKPIEGLIIRVVNAASGQVVAETTTRGGRWSLTIPQGPYAFEVPNAAAKGFRPLPRRVTRIEFGREDLQNDLNRFVPEVVEIQSRRLVFTYPDTPGLPVQGVALRVNDEVVDMVSSVGRDGSRHTVTLMNPLEPGDRVEVAVRIDGLLTLFSVGRAVEGGAL
jgi:hypothetical protein